jgi:hypothetical protein
MAPAPQSKTTRQTSFVSGLAWSFIGLAGISLFLALLQYVLFSRVLPMDIFREMMLDAIKLHLLPQSTMTIVEHIHGITVVMIFTSLLTLVLSIGLLKRKSWARVAFVWLLIVAALVHFAGAFLPFYNLPGVLPAANAIPPELRGIVTIIKSMLSVVSIVMGIAFAGFFAWAAKRLLSAEIKQEFTGPQ